MYSWESARHSSWFPSLRYAVARLFNRRGSKCFAILLTSSASVYDFTASLKFASLKSVFPFRRNLFISAIRWSSFSRTSLLSGGGRDEYKMIFFNSGGRGRAWGNSFFSWSRVKVALLSVVQALRIWNEKCSVSFASSSWQCTLNCIAFS